MSPTLSHSILFAQGISLFCLIFVFIFLINGKNIKQVFKDLAHHTGSVFIVGIFSICIGLFIALLHNKWSADWRVVITIVGWLSVLKGIVILASPNYLLKTVKSPSFDKLILVVVFISFLIALYLGYYGFLSY